eukprot:GHVN01004175.1.p1 GENE.GHVN01004175.1~~GHVN01004175.1.p1  ORF type:complete len:999 (+),score=109.69 GHVN01004175.1:2121-5117(+)
MEKKLQESTSGLAELLDGLNNVPDDSQTDYSARNRQTEAPTEKKHLKTFLKHAGKVAASAKAIVEASIFSEDPSCDDATNCYATIKTPLTVGWVVDRCYRIKRFTSLSLAATQGILWSPLMDYSAANGGNDWREIATSYLKTLGEMNQWCSLCNTYSYTVRLGRNYLTTDDEAEMDLKAAQDEPTDLEKAVAPQNKRREGKRKALWKPSGTVNDAAIGWERLTDPIAEVPGDIADQMGDWEDTGSGGFGNTFTQFVDKIFMNERRWVNEMVEKSNEQRDPQPPAENEDWAQQSLAGHLQLMRDALYQLGYDMETGKHTISQLEGLIPAGAIKQCSKIANMVKSLYDAVQNGKMRKARAVARKSYRKAFPMKEFRIGLAKLRYTWLATVEVDNYKRPGIRNYYPERSAANLNAQIDTVSRVLLGLKTAEAVLTFHRYGGLMTCVTSLMGVAKKALDKMGSAIKNTERGGQLAAFMGIQKPVSSTGDYMGVVKSGLMVAWRAMYARRLRKTVKRGMKHMLAPWKRWWVGLTWFAGSMGDPGKVSLYEDLDWYQKGVHLVDVPLKNTVKTLQMQLAYPAGPMSDVMEGWRMQHFSGSGGARIPKDETQQEIAIASEWANPNRRKTMSDQIRASQRKSSMGRGTVFLMRVGPHNKVGLSQVACKCATKKKSRTSRQFQTTASMLALFSSWTATKDGFEGVEHLYGTFKLRNPLTPKFSKLVNVHMGGMTKSQMKYWRMFALIKANEFLTNPLATAEERLLINDRDQAWDNFASVARGVLRNIAKGVLHYVSKIPGLEGILGRRFMQRNKERHIARNMMRADWEQSFFGHKSLKGVIQKTAMGLTAHMLNPVLRGALKNMVEYKDTPVGKIGLRDFVNHSKMGLERRHAVATLARGAWGAIGFRRQWMAWANAPMQLQSHPPKIFLENKAGKKTPVKAKSDILEGGWQRLLSTLLDKRGSASQFNCLAFNPQDNIILDNEGSKAFNPVTQMMDGPFKKFSMVC